MVIAMIMVTEATMEAGTITEAGITMEAGTIIVIIMKDMEVGIEIITNPIIALAGRPLQLARPALVALDAIPIVIMKAINLAVYLLRNQKSHLTVNSTLATKRRSITMSALTVGTIFMSLRIVSPGKKLSMHANAMVGGC